MAQVAPYHLVDGTNTNKPLLASGSRDYSVKVWAPTTTGAWKLKTELSHRSEVFCLTGAFQGQVISGGADWNLKLWDVNACEYGEPVQTLEAHSKSVKCCATSPDSANLLVSGSEDETMCVWDLRSNGLVHRIDTGSAVRCLYWANGLLCAGGGVTLDSWSGASLEPMGGWLRFFDPRAGFQPLSDASIYPVSRVVRSDGDDRRLRTAHVLSTMCISGFQLANHQQVVVSGGDDKKLRVWTSAKSQQVLGETAPFSTKPQLSFELGSDKTIPISVDCLEVFQV